MDTEQETAEQPEIVTPLPKNDRVIFETLEEAQRLYQKYLDVVQIGDLTKLLAHRVETPPRTDLPLTLTIR